MDTLTKEDRSKRMALVKAADTQPELVVRRLVRQLGFRVATHTKDLPGRPDIVRRSAQQAIFVHGCFWHRHPSSRCVLARVPKSRLEFWLPKLESNRRRDVAQQRRLRRMGWSVMVVWECELRGAGKLKSDPRREAKLLARLSKFLEGTQA